MVTETILQLYKLRESGDFVTLSEEDDCYEFALRSPFSFGQFASLAQVTCPGLNKFGLLKVIKNAGTHRVLIPLSENNFTEVVTEAIQQQMSAQEDRHRSKLKICAWEKALSLTVEVATANSGLCEDRRLTPGFDRETGPVGFLAKSNESEIGKVMSDEANRKSNQSSTGRPKARTAVESFAGAGGSAVNRQCGERGTCRNSSAPTAGNYRQKAVRRALARFVKHVNFDDNAIVYAGAPFVKIWRIRNDSSTAWPQNSLIMAVGGESMIPETAPQKVPVPSLKPGEEQNIEISLTAPHAPGKYQGFYRFCSSEGKKFGQRLSCQIMVVDSNSTASESTSSDTSSDESSGDEERLRKVENNQGSRRGAKKQAKQKQRCEKRKRKLEKKAKKLRRKLEKVEKKLWKIHRSEESLLSQKRASNMVFDGGFPVAIPATFDDLKQSAATVSTVGVDANEEAIGDGIKCLSLEASTVGKGSNWDSTYQQLLSLGFSDTEVRKAIEKSGGDVVECLKYLTK